MGYATIKKLIADLITRVKGLDDIHDDLVTAQADLDNPDQYKADVSNLDAAVSTRATPADVEGKVENAVDTPVTHDIQVADGTTEQTIVEIQKTGIYDLAVTMDLDALNTAAEGGVVVFRVYEKTDGANYADSPIGYAEWTDGDDFYPSFMVFMAHQFTKITVQCGVAVTAQRDIVVRYKVRDLGA
jgi:hypothetical protein